MLRSSNNPDQELVNLLVLDKRGVIEQNSVSSNGCSCELVIQVFYSSHLMCQECMTVSLPPIVADAIIR